MVNGHAKVPWKCQILRGGAWSLLTAWHEESHCCFFRANLRGRDWRNLANLAEQPALDAPKISNASTRNAMISTLMPSESYYVR